MPRRPDPCNSVILSLHALYDECASLPNVQISCSVTFSASEVPSAICLQRKPPRLIHQQLILLKMPLHSMSGRRNKAEQLHMVPAPSRNPMERSRPPHIVDLMTTRSLCICSPVTAINIRFSAGRLTFRGRCIQEPLALAPCHIYPQKCGSASTAPYSAPIKLCGLISF